MSPNGVRTCFLLTSAFCALRADLGFLLMYVDGTWWGTVIIPLRGCWVSDACVPLLWAQIMKHWVWLCSLNCANPKSILRDLELRTWSPQADYETCNYGLGAHRRRWHCKGRYKGWCSLCLETWQGVGKAMYRSAGQCSFSWELSQGVPEGFSHMSMSSQEPHLPVQTCIFLRYVLLGLGLGGVSRRLPSSLHYYSWVCSVKEACPLEDPHLVPHAAAKNGCHPHTFSARLREEPLALPPVSWDCLGMCHSWRRLWVSWDICAD